MHPSFPRCISLLYLVLPVVRSLLHSLISLCIFLLISSCFISPFGKFGRHYWNRFPFLLQTVFQVVYTKWLLQRCWLASFLCEELILPIFDDWVTINPKIFWNSSHASFTSIRQRVSDGRISKHNVRFCMVPFHNGDWNCVPLSENITLGFPTSKK